MAEQEFESLLFEHPLELFADFAIHRAENVVEEFDDKHFGAKPPPDRTKLEADHTGADNDDLAGTLPSESAPVEETTCFSSISRPGSGATSEPVAMTIFFVTSSVSHRRPPSPRQRRPF